MYCVETNDLTYRFSSKENILNNINLQVPDGAIYGFLGPNGAGKTTTLKLLLGLLKKQEGMISIFNKPFSSNRIEILRKTGSLIESPSLYGHLTAGENLKVWQKISRCPEKNIMEVLELVGLKDTDRKKVKQFSLGMKQRLGIAVALLNNPSLLILDEPTNGLDPNGMLEIRELLKKINTERGITILISSHLLNEIEKLVTHAGIIHKGSIMFQGTLNELMSRQQQSSFTIIDTNENSKTIKILQGHNIPASLKNDRLLLPVTNKYEIAKLNAELVQQGIEVYEISIVKNDLETIFMGLINN
ncbi:MAG: ATP-binding cassette domain-containing protein [Ferruginibacter sp.]